MAKEVDNDPNKVDQYQKTTKTGKVVTVNAYQRNNDGVTAAAATDPTRPPLAAKMGTFAAGRAIPNVWSDTLKNDPLKHKITNTLVNRTEDPETKIQSAINDEDNEREIRERYGVSSKVAKDILIALKEKSARDGKK